MSTMRSSDSAHGTAHDVVATHGDTGTANVFPNGWPKMVFAMAKSRSPPWPKPQSHSSWLLGTARSRSPPRPKPPSQPNSGTARSRSPPRPQTPSQPIRPPFVLPRSLHTAKSSPQLRHRSQFQPIAWVGTQPIAWVGRSLSAATSRSAPLPRAPSGFAVGRRNRIANPCPHTADCLC